MASPRKRTKTIRKRKVTNGGKARKRAIRAAVRKAADAKVDIL